MRHVWHPQAEAGATISRKFATIVRQTLASLSEHPAIGKPVQVQARSIPLHDFPFDLVYRVFPDTLVIIALANQSRRPGYWVGRQ